MFFHLHSLLIHSWGHSKNLTLNTKQPECLMLNLYSTTSAEFKVFDDCSSSCGFWDRNVMISMFWALRFGEGKLAIFHLQTQCYLPNKLWQSVPIKRKNSHARIQNHTWHWAIGILSSVSWFFCFEELAFSFHLQVCAESIFSIKQNLHQNFLQVELKQSNCNFESNFNYWGKE